MSRRKDINTSDIAIILCTFIYIIIVITKPVFTDETTNIPVAAEKKKKLPMMNTGGIRMNHLWPHKKRKPPVVSYFLAGPEDYLPNITFLRETFGYFESHTCIRFKELETRSSCYDTYDDEENSVCVEVGDSDGSCYTLISGFIGIPGQLLIFPSRSCPFNEALESVAMLLGMTREHQRDDSGNYIRLAVAQTGAGRFSFSQRNIMRRCRDYVDDSPYDLLSVTHADTFGSFIHQGMPDGMFVLEASMVVQVLNIRYQWLVDHKFYNSRGLSFYDKVAFHNAYKCSNYNMCVASGGGKCLNGGFRNTHCKCECPPRYRGSTCARKVAVDPLLSECSITVREDTSFTLREIGLKDRGRSFYACDVTVRSPSCMRPRIVVDTSALEPFRRSSNIDFKRCTGTICLNSAPYSHAWCRSYFTLMLKHSPRGWRTYCLDYFFNEEVLYFMPHTNLNNTFAYMQVHIKRAAMLKPITQIKFSVQFVDVPRCQPVVPVMDGSAFVLDGMVAATAIICYFVGVALGGMAWTVVRSLTMSPPPSVTDSTEDSSGGDGSGSTAGGGGSGSTGGGGGSGSTGGSGNTGGDGGSGGSGGGGGGSGGGTADSDRTASSGGTGGGVAQPGEKTVTEAAAYPVVAANYPVAAGDYPAPGSGEAAGWTEPLTTSGYAAYNTPGDAGAAPAAKHQQQQEQPAPAPAKRPTQQLPAVAGAAPRGSHGFPAVMNAFRERVTSLRNSFSTSQSPAASGPQAPRLGHRAPRPPGPLRPPPPGLMSARPRGPPGVGYRSPAPPPGVRPPFPPGVRPPFPPGVRPPFPPGVRPPFPPGVRPPFPPGVRPPFPPGVRSPFPPGVRPPFPPGARPPFPPGARPPFPPGARPPFPPMPRGSASGWPPRGRGAPPRFRPPPGGFSGQPRGYRTQGPRFPAPSQATPPGDRDAWSAQR